MWPGVLESAWQSRLPSTYIYNSSPHDMQVSVLTRWSSYMHFFFQTLNTCVDLRWLDADIKRMLDAHLTLKKKREWNEFCPRQTSYLTLWHENWRQSLKTPQIKSKQTSERITRRKLTKCRIDHPLLILTPSYVLCSPVTPQTCDRVTITNPTLPTCQSWTWQCGHADRPYFPLPVGTQFRELGWKTGLPMKKKKKKKKKILRISSFCQLCKLPLLLFRPSATVSRNGLMERPDGVMYVSSWRTPPPHPTPLADPPLPGMITWWMVGFYADEAYLFGGLLRT